MASTNVTGIVYAGGYYLPLDSSAVNKGTLSGHFETRNEITRKTKNIHINNMRCFSDCLYAFDPLRLQTVSPEKAETIFNGLGIDIALIPRIGHIISDGMVRLPFIKALERDDDIERGLTDEFITSCKALVNESFEKEAREKIAKKAQKAEDELVKKLQNLELHRREGLLRKKAIADAAAAVVAAAVAASM